MNMKEGWVCNLSQSLLHAAGQHWLLNYWLLTIGILFPVKGIEQNYPSLLMTDFRDLWM